MSKIVGLACTAMLLLLFARPQSGRFSKYKTVEAYEIRPGILIMPSYSDDGQVCEIGLEKVHYSPELIRLDPSLSRKEIDQIADELVPANERGSRSKEFGRDLITIVGHGMTTNADYENVSIQIYGNVLRPSRKSTTVDDIAATIKWKNRKCHAAPAL
jgi:hypothetical protein